MSHAFLISLFLVSQVLAQPKENYQEKYRPQFHFSPASNWMNDPNGLVFYLNEYHLFFQYNPFGIKAEHASWGHAVSKDLVHWKLLPVAIPEENGVIAASGGAVVDWNNTSGFGKDGKPPLVAIYAGVCAGNINQYLAFSNDSGRTWNQYRNNPVLKDRENFRDPKIFWYPPGKKWIMVISTGTKVRFCESRNLKEWKVMSEFGPAGVKAGGWECPDLFPLEVDGNPKKIKWVLNVNMTSSGGVAGDSGAQYFIGNFNGKRFTEDEMPGSNVHWDDYGKDFYAVVSFSDIPKSDGRRIWIGWMSNWLYAQEVPTYPWRGAQSIPRSLSLKTFSDGIRLIQKPVVELRELREELHRFKNITLNEKDSLFENNSLSGNTLEIEAEIEPGTASRFCLEVRKGLNQKTIIGYDVTRHELFVDRSHSGDTHFSNQFSKYQTAPLSTSSQYIKLHIFVDWSSVEVFADDGKVVMTDLIFPSVSSSGFAILARHGTVRIKDLKVWKLRSIWN